MMICLIAVVAHGSVEKLKTYSRINSFAWLFTIIVDVRVWWRKVVQIAESGTFMIHNQLSRHGFLLQSTSTLIRFIRLKYLPCFGQPSNILIYDCARVRATIKNMRITDIHISWSLTQYSVCVCVKYQQHIIESTKHGRTVVVIRIDNTTTNRENAQRIQPIWMYCSPPALLFHWIVPVVERKVLIGQIAGAIPIQFECASVHHTYTHNIFCLHTLLERAGIIQYKNVRLSQWTAGTDEHIFHVREMRARAQWIELMDTFRTKHPYSCLNFYMLWNICFFSVIVQWLWSMNEWTMT